MHQLFNILPPIILVALLYFIVIRFFKILERNQKDFLYVQILMDTIVGGIDSPIHRALYHKLRELSPDEALAAIKKKSDFLKSMTNDSFIEARKVLEKIKDKTEDSDKKEEYKKAIEELDGMFNLLSTIDENTAPEYVHQIMGNVLSSINKLREKGIHIGIERIDPFEQI